MIRFDHDSDGDDAAWDPLQSGGAAPPPVLGGGCSARFDPETLNEDSGADYAPQVGRPESESGADKPTDGQA